MKFSAEFDEFLRSGFLSPLAEAMTREQVVEILGQPEYWFGKEQGSNWKGRPIPWDQSPALGYGSTHLSFHQNELVDCSVSYYEKPFDVPATFSYLPNQTFTFGELRAHLRERAISHFDLRKDCTDDTMLITEGLVRIGTWHMDESDSAKVINMYSNRGGAIDSIKIYGSEAVDIQ